MEFSKQEYWSRLPFLLQGIFQTQRLNPHLLCLLHWQVDSLPLQHLGSSTLKYTVVLFSRNLSYSTSLCTALFFFFPLQLFRYSCWTAFSQTFLFLLSFMDLQMRVGHKITIRRIIIIPAFGEPSCIY